MLFVFSTGESNGSGHGSAVLIKILWIGDQFEAAFQPSPPVEDYAEVEVLQQSLEEDELATDYSDHSEERVSWQPITQNIRGRVDNIAGPSHPRALMIIWR